MIQQFQMNDREGKRYTLAGLILLVIFCILIGFSIYKNRLKEKKLDQEISQGVQAVMQGLDGDCSALEEAKQIFMEAASSRIWLNKEVSWVGFCEDMMEFCGKDHDQLEKNLKQIIELGENKVAKEAKFQLAMVQIWRRDFSSSEQLLKDLSRARDTDHKAESYLRILTRLKRSRTSENI